MEDKYVIYAHINKINQKIYIGQTHHKDPNQRWLNGWGYKNSTHFWNAIQKYGWDNFEHIVLFDNLSQERANIIEEYLIKKYDSSNRSKGYNIRLGGKNSRLPKEIRQKISKAHMGKTIPEEVRKKISEATKGENNPFYGRTHSEETRKRMVENHWNCSGENHYLFGKHMKEETKEKLRQANLGENNPHYGIPLTEQQKKNISMALTGIKRSDETKQRIKDNHADFSGKNHPLYGKHHNEETKKKLSISCSTPVDMLDLEGKYIKTFYGMSEAQRETGANYMGISRCCNEKQKTCGGYKWIFSEKTS